MRAISKTTSKNFQIRLVHHCSKPPPINQLSKGQKRNGEFKNVPEP